LRGGDVVRRRNGHEEVAEALTLAVMLRIRRTRPSARLVGWANAWLAGHVSLDDAVDGVIGDDGALFRLPEPDGAERIERTALALAALRGRGTTALRLVLPVSGDPSGLPGPGEFNLAALAAGEAALTVDGAPLGFVPVRSPIDGLNEVLWRAYPVTALWGPGCSGGPGGPGGPGGHGLPSLSEAERDLHETLREATNALLRLDVARWRPEVAEALRELRDGAGAEDALPPGYPPRARRVLVLARRVGAITGLALADPGAAVSAGEMAVRTATLRPLIAASRRAEVAAYNAITEPSRDR
jgi:hypothetical protein